jgi:peptide/nickel transport system substrate-binding protein
MRGRILGMAAGLALAAAPAAAQQALTVGVAGAFTSMDPHYFNLGPNNVLTSYVFDPLLRFDPQMQPEPSLAESWRSVDEKTWEFKLRPGATFHDGTPLTAADVAFTFARIPQVLNSPSSFMYAVKPIARIEEVDASTLRFHTTAPEPLLPYNMTGIRIISKKHGEGAQTSAYNSGAAAIGTGPFRLKEFAVGDSAVFERNEAWWDKKPAWSKVTYRAVTNDASRIAALRSGEIDIIDQVPTRDVEDLAKQPKIAVVSAAGQRLIYLAPDVGRSDNMWATDAAGKRLDKNPLQDVRVRRALSLAINRDGIKDRVMDGFAAPTGQLMPTGASGFEPAIKPDPYDPEAAKKLLAEAGFPNGFGITLHGPNNRYVNDAKILEALAQMWTRVGVKTQVEAMPAATFFGRAAKGEFQIRLTGWASDTGEASSNLITLIASSAPEKGRGQYPEPWRYGNPAVDAIVEKSLTTIDVAAREALYRESERLAMPELPIIPLHHQMNVFGMRKGLKFSLRMQEGVRAWDVSPE